MLIYYEYYYQHILFHFTDAPEEATEITSDDDSQCVVHYPELMPNKPSRIILLSDRSYGKLIECKRIRMEFGDTTCQEQCEAIPVPHYDPKRDGYHRQCYMKFVKSKIENMKTTAEKCTENQRKTQGENCSEESKTQNKNCHEQCKTDIDKRIAENENNSDHNYNDHEISTEKQRKTENEDYSGDSKTMGTNFTDQSTTENDNCSNGSMNENGNHSENCYNVQCEAVNEHCADGHSRKFENKNCHEQSNIIRHKHSENHKKTKYKDHNGFLNE